MRLLKLVLRLFNSRSALCIQIMIRRLISSFFSLAGRYLDIIKESCGNIYVVYELDAFWQVPIEQKMVVEVQKHLGAWMLNARNLFAFIFLPQSI